MDFNKRLNEKFDKFHKNTEKIKNKINYKRSYKYILLLFFIATGYIFFLSSGVFFETNNRLTTTELNKKIALKNSEVFIKEEQFNEEKNLLEVKLGVNKTNINFANDFEFEAITRENTNKKLPVEFMTVDENNIVIFITTPKKWSAIALDIKEKNAKENGETRVYIDERICKKNNDLDKRTKEEYMIENIENDIKNIENVIAKYEEEIVEKKSTIGNTKEEINILESKKEYLTDKEKLEANQKIDSYKSSISSLENAIKDIEKNILEEKEKLSLANKKINDIIKSLPDYLYNKYR
ncbi:hypothetical protein NSA50_18055 [Clostridium sp. DSM 100503]|uniref:hypothetical protein n=1 Tax=Clostridium sp. DSM 100503 TaxID=2963282 RepID=UPI00214A0C42|nr:hypothetical protein [Clostridium sp. DSM 100503]MCR1952909.1 hypothetical protein [Clostridium sp. DSM 100503]